MNRGIGGASGWYGTGGPANGRKSGRTSEGNADQISLGVVAKMFPVERVKEVLEATGKRSQRQRDLPAPVVVYYAIALALYRQVSYRKVLRCLWFDRGSPP